MSDVTKIEEMILGGKTAAAIVKSCDCSLAEIKVTALRLKRQEVITHSEAAAYFIAKEKVSAAKRGPKTKTADASKTAKAAKAAEAPRKRRSRKKATAPVETADLAG